MPRCSIQQVFTALVCTCALLTASPSAGQGRTSGQIVGTVKDASGAVIPKADLILIDNGTGATAEAKSGTDGNFVFPNLQPGRYQITATMQGFNPVTIQEVVVGTARSVDVVVQFEVQGVKESVTVEGRSQVVETTSTTIASTVNNEQIAKLPLAGRNILGFALLVPGAAQSTGARDSEYNGLPGGAINITLDGINNNSARFRSGGTSFFTFAPVRLGAIEEVTISTAGLGAEAGAEGAVQVQFVTKRGTNSFRGSVFDQYRNNKLNAWGFVDKARGIPKTEDEVHEYGANFGGPILKNKLFFFANFEQVYQPGEATVSRSILRPDTQRGIFTYNDLDNVVRQVDLLDLARRNGLPSTIDPFVQEQLRTVNSAVTAPGTFTSSPTNFLSDTYTFIIPETPNVNLYPTFRVDYQARQNLSMRGVLNLHYRDLPTEPTYPDFPRYDNGFTSTYYIASGGADWTISPNLFMGLSFGGQSNFEEFFPGNTMEALYGGPNSRINLPLIDEPYVVDDWLPQPRNNPVWNVTNTLTWLKGKHTYTMGGTFRRTTMYEQIGGAPPSITVGLGTGDPAQSVIAAANLPRIRSNDVANAQALYALMVGRVSGSGGTFNIDPDTKEYSLRPAFRREAQNVGGVFVQDQWRLNPALTLNYGLRWELTGAATNPSGIYSGPNVEDLYGISGVLFQPGAAQGIANPQVYLKPSPYKSDWVNPAPNVGVAWNPEKPGGLLGAILGKAVYRGNYGVNYYDEGLINFQTFAGGGPGTSQSLTLPGFTPGSLNLQTPLPAYNRAPLSFTFPQSISSFTFARSHSTIDPDIQTPYVQNWTIGYQRELWNSAALEIRYVGNRGSNLWRGYNLNEVNIVENGFVDEFRNAQRNLEINLANGRTGFANNGLAGQVALPIFQAAFGARGSQGAVAANSGFTNANFVQQLQQGQAGRVANTLAGTDLYICRMVGNAIPECAARGYNATGAYAANVFQVNPYAAGSNVRGTDGRGELEVRRAAAAVPSALSQRHQRDGQLHLRQGANRPLHGRRLESSRLHHAARQVARLGTDGLRPAAQLPDLRHVRAAVRPGPPLQHREPGAQPDRRRLGAVDDRPHPERPSVLPRQRPADVQPAGFRDRPPRHLAAGPAGSSADSARPERKYLLLRRVAHRPRRPCERDAADLPDHARRTRRAGLPLQPWHVDGGYRTGEDVLAAGRLARQLRGAVHQCVQPPQPDRRRHGRCLAEHRLEHVRPDDWKCARLASDPVPSRLLLLTLPEGRKTGSSEGRKGFRQPTFRTFRTSGLPDFRPSGLPAFRPSAFRLLATTDLEFTTMSISRRRFVQSATLAGAAAYAAPAAAREQRGGGPTGPVPESIRALKPLPGTAAPITQQERLARIEKARKLMAEDGIGAIVLETGTSMTYFANVRWGLSERPFLLVIPQKGELAYLCPGFEEARAREITTFTKDVRVWQEDEDWGATVHGILKDRGVSTAKIGVEERVRFFIADGIAQAAPASKVVLATPVTAGCRMIKSPTEIALMQRANDITIEAFKAALATLREGMTQGELGGNIRAAFNALGGPGGSAMIGFGRVLGVPARQHHAAAAQGRRHRSDRRRLQHRGLSVRHHADDRARQAHQEAERRVEPGAGGTERRVQGGASRRDLRVGRCGGAQGDHRCGLRPRIQGARTSPPHRPRHRHGRPRVDQLRQGQQDEARPRDVLQRRADDCHLRRVRYPSRGLPLHHRKRTEVLLEAVGRDRSTVWVITTSSRRRRRSRRSRRTIWLRF